MTSPSLPHDPQANYIWVDLPLSEVVFRCYNQSWLLWISPDLDLEYNTRDVCLYEIKGGGFRFYAIGVFGKRFVSYDLRRADKTLHSKANEALLKWRKSHPNP